MSNTCCNFLFITAAVDDSSQFFGYTNLAGTAQIFHAGAVKFTANFLTDNGCTSKNCNILQHGFTTITEARSFDCNSFEGAAQFIDNQSCQSFTFNIFGNNKQFTAALDNFFQYRHNILNHSDFAVCDKYERVIENSFHFIRICCHIGRNISAVKLHTFDCFQAGFHRFGFFNSNNAVIANFFHSVSNQAADLFISCGNGCNLGFSFLSFNFFGNSFQFFY